MDILHCAIVRQEEEMILGSLLSTQRFLQILLHYYHQYPVLQLHITLTSKCLAQCIETPLNYSLMLVSMLKSD